MMNFTKYLCDYWDRDSGRDRGESEGMNYIKKFYEQNPWIDDVEDYYHLGSRSKRVIDAFVSKILGDLDLLKCFLDFFASDYLVTKFRAVFHTLFKQTQLKPHLYEKHILLIVKKPIPDHVIWVRLKCSVSKRVLCAMIVYHSCDASWPYILGCNCEICDPRGSSFLAKINCPIFCGNDMVVHSLTNNHLLSILKFSCRPFETRYSVENSCMINLCVELL
jgi:hypothetical protein